MKLYCLCCAVLLTVHCEVFSQVVTKQSIEVNIGGRSFKSGIPFDEVFAIEGKVGPAIERVTLKYGPVNRKEVDKYFSKSPSYTSDPAEPGFNFEGPIRKWDRTSDDEKETSFALGEIGPLRPNVKYKFKFTTYHKNNFDDAKKKLLREKIYEKMEEYLSRPQRLEPTMIDQLYNDLNALPRLVSGKQVFDIDGNNVDIKPFAGPLAASSQQFIDLRNAIVDLESTELPNTISTIKSKAINLGDAIKYIINKSKQGENSIALTDDAKRILDSPVDETIPNIGKTKVVDVLGIVHGLILNPVTTDNLLKGRSKFNGTAFIISTEYDANSVRLIYSALSIIANPKFAEISKNNRSSQPRPVIKDSSRNEVEELVQELIHLNDAYKSRQTKEEDLKKIKDKIHDFFEDTYTVSTYSLIETSTIDVVSEKTPYVSVDVGITGMPNLYKVEGTTQGNSLYFFTHQAANIYFSPVNKKAPLSMFKGRYWFGKAFSLHIGIAQLVGNFNTARYSGSLAEKSCFMFGGGVRFNRVTKLGLSCILVNRKNINPTLEGSTLKPFISGSFSVDINVAKAFQDVGKSLNFFN